MQLLLTDLDAGRHGAEIRAAAPDATWLVIGPDGAIDRGGEDLSWEEAAPDAAWISADAFESGTARKLLGFLVRASTLRWIHTSAAGVDHPVFSRITATGATLTNAHVGDVNISEYVLGQVLAHRLGLRRWDDAQRRHAWEPHQIRELAGATWLVVGVGAIGSAVARRARAFGCPTIGVRRSPTGSEPVDEMLRPAELLDALPRADVVVLSAPASPETERMVDATFLRRMREGSMLLNVARGSLVDEAALLAALDRGVPEVAVLDVAGTEPLPDDSPLWDHPRVVLTPHSSGMGDGHFRRGVAAFCENLRRYAAGETLRDVVDPR